MQKARFQSFIASTNPSQCAPRLAALREALRKAGIDGFVVPRADQFQGEYVADNEQRLAWLTGFTGSYGAAVVLAKKAAILTDGRYVLQAAAQTDKTLFKVVNIAAQSPADWVAANLGKGKRLGYDPRLLTVDDVARYEAAVKKAGSALVALEQNPLDAVWTDRPAPPQTPIVLHPLELSGEESAAKLARIGAALAEEKLDALVISDPHGLAWTFNIRGGDVSNTPLPHGYVIVPREGKPTLFVDGRKLSNAVRNYLASLADLAEPAAFEAALAALGQKKARVRLDATTAGMALKLAIEAAGGIADVGKDPTALLKSPKNAVEIANARSAYLRDCAALAKFLAWFDEAAPKGGETEISAAVKLEGFRLETGKLKDLSFSTISAAGPNAALPHYRVNEETNRKIEPGIYLIDAGAQYEDGTTDVTRVLAIGAPTAVMRDRFTRVLKGMIAISRVIFPKGTCGAQLDTLARQYLWAAGVDFDHGTGHGIGSYLSVHEGPQRIAKMTSAVPLQPGMIISNEPGYYKAGAFGIRIENILVVQPVEKRGAEREMLGFETLTYAPIDKRLIAKKLLTKDERQWLDAYHAEVRAKISPLLDAATTRWLEAATAPL